MPETVGNHGLYCPDFDDYAAVALYMQDLGTRIDEQLSVQQDALNAFLNQPTIIVTNAVGKVITTPGSLNNVWDTVVFNNSSFMSYDLATNRLLIGSAAGAGVTVAYPRGAYSMGGTASFTDVGATTAGSGRSFLMVASDFTLPASAPDILQARDSSEARGTGGEDLTAKGDFVLTGVSGVGIEHSVFSGNIASNTNILAGGFMWCTYNGPTDVIEVA